MDKNEKELNKNENNGTKTISGTKKNKKKRISVDPDSIPSGFDVKAPQMPPVLRNETVKISFLCILGLVVSVTLALIAKDVQILILALVSVCAMGIPISWSIAYRKGQFVELKGNVREVEAVMYNAIFPPYIYFAYEGNIYCFRMKNKKQTIRQGDYIVLYTKKSNLIKDEEKTIIKDFAAVKITTTITGDDKSGDKRSIKFFK